jgi:transposase
MYINGSVGILFASKPVDFRKSFDGLCGVVRNNLGCDPADGTLYVFYNRRRDRIKLLVWDSDGFWLHYKRLEIGTFEIPQFKPQAERIVLTNLQLDLLLKGVQLTSIRLRKRFTKKELGTLTPHSA